jgi:probable F420-dependent oxidoreductase
MATSPRTGRAVEENTAMRFGFVLPNNWGIDDVAAVVDLARRAEDAGFDSVWVNHHLLNVGYVGERLGQRPYHDAMTVLTWAAASTSHVELGTSVLVIPYLNPFVLAKAMATLDQLSGGRVRCGVGVGSLPEENEAIGVVAYADRGRYADEFLGVMRTLWDDDEPAFHGRFFSFGPVRAAPKPWQGRRLPVAVGGNRPPALRRVAQFGDCWHALGVSVDGMRKRLARLDELLEQSGRSRRDVVISLRFDVPSGSTPSSLAAVCNDYRDAGVAEMVMSLGSPDIEAQRQLLDSVASAVIPALR